MYTFSKESEAQLATVHPDLQRVMRVALEIKDFKVLEGRRGEEKQRAAFRSGASKVDWPDGKHNKIPSEAVDVIPWDTVKHAPVSWENENEFCLLAGVILAVAHMLDIPVRWGHDWNHNSLTTDEKGKLVDMPHFELIRAESPV